MNDVEKIIIEGQEFYAIHHMFGYYINREGKIYSTKRGKYLSPFYNKSTGKYMIVLHSAGVKKQVAISKLLEQTFGEDNFIIGQGSV